MDIALNNVAEESSDEDGDDNVVDEDKIPIERCFELTNELIHGLEQHSLFFPRHK